MSKIEKMLNQFDLKVPNFGELMDRKFIDKIIIISNQLPLTSAPILRQNT